MRYFKQTSTILFFSFFPVLLFTIASAQQYGPVRTFGTGLSQNKLYTFFETEIFQYRLSPTATFGVMQHFWCTGDPAVDQAIWNYYLDDEDTPSIQFNSYMVTGAGFIDQSAPWGTRWIGKQAQSGAWINNFRIPFHKSIRITARLSSLSNVTDATFWTIVRGSENLPSIIGGYTLPANARLVQNRIENVTLNPLEFLDVAHIESGNGFLFFHTLAVKSETPNFMEGCYHAYTPLNASWPGILISTGTEDYFASAFYFNGGKFHDELSGYTHSFSDNTTVEIAAYRFHELDPIFFQDGFRFVWRNGDVIDGNGFKCTAQEGKTAGNPKVSNVWSYSWSYVWEPEEGRIQNSISIQ